MRMFAENPVNPGFHWILRKYAKKSLNGGPVAVITWSSENKQKLWH